MPRGACLRSVGANAGAREITSEPGLIPALMPDCYLLDTSAFLTLTDREPGVDRVRDLLKAARRGEIPLHACFVTLAEVQYILTYDLGVDRALLVTASIRRFPIY
jgi:predicted nucleic acid-binding protein